MYSAINVEVRSNPCLVFGFTCLSVGMCPVASGANRAGISQEIPSVSTVLRVRLSCSALFC